MLHLTVHRGVLWDHYGYEDNEDKEVVPIIDSAYVLLDFNAPSSQEQAESRKNVTSQTIGCLELCMFAEGSRHQEEIIVTGMKGRIEGTNFHIYFNNSTWLCVNDPFYTTLMTISSLSPRKQGFPLPTPH